MQATDVSSLSGVVKEDHGGDHGVLLLWSQDDNGCQPQLVSLPDEISVIQAAVGQAHGLLLSQGGQLYGFERLSPSKPDHLLRTTDSLADADEQCQARHVLLKDLQDTFPERRENSPFSDAVDNEDDLSSKFENGEGVSFSWLQPQPLASLVGRVVISIATGVSHCGVVCQDGAVYMWGKNTEGQCGIRDVPFVGKPTTLTFLGEDSTQSSQNAGDINVTQLSCGESHTLALTRQGELWSWGTGPQIGQGSGVSFSPCPHLVEALRGRRVLQASSGAQHSIALVEVLTVLPSLEPDRCGRCQQLVVTMTDTEDHVLISDEHYCLERGKICLMPENQSTVDFVVESDGNGQGLLEPVSGEQDNSSVGGSCSQSMDGVENLLLPSSAVSLERVASDGDKTLGDGTNRQPDCLSLDGAVGAEAPTVPPTLWNRKYWSLVDMRAVRDECSRRLSLPSLLSNLAQVPSMVRRGEPHSASVSNPRGSSSDLQHADESSLLTEVWSWGDGAMGQLGLGDLCPRWQPVCVKAAGRREVVKVAAGAKHSLALTSRGQVFSWGSNYSKQLGLDKPFSAVPCPIKLGIEHIARDVAAGRFHSLVLADASSGSTDVLCFGTMGDGPGKSMEHGESVTLPHPDGLLTAVSGSGERAVGFCCTNPDPILRAMDELCRSEHLFLMRLSQLEEKLKPLLRPGISRATRSSAVDSSLKALGSCFCVLCNLVGQHCRSLADCLAFHLNPMDLLLLNQPEIFTSTYKQYLVALANFFAVDGLESILKTDSETTKNALQNIQEYWPQLDEVPSPAQSFINLLEFPITHVQQYEEFIGKLEIFWLKDSVKEQFFSGLHTLWESLMTFWMQQKADAEKTRLFWVSCSTKLSDSLRQPDRRLVRESRCCPLLLQNAARFSIHWFILFNDMFVHVQFSNHQILPLETLWVDATQDSPENSFKIITPEERLLLSTPDAKGKVEWLRLLNRTLDQALSDSTQERTDETKELYRQSLFTSRNVVHTFYRDPRLKRATYQGSWVCGKPHGQGKLMWPDGRQYKGSFKNGLEDGIGELRVPNRLLQKDDVYQGPWKAAKMHGHGVMHYANGDTYEGSFVDGARHGHGMHRSGSFASLSSSIYIGQWFQDRRSGYGVLDDITRGEKYMGMWLDDNRHGQGVVVSQFGLYYEGIFSMNKMAGQGILLAEDNSCFQGEFTADLALNGKGMLTLPSGDQLAGNFSGVWGGELKVTGTFRKTFPGEKEKSTTKPQWGDLAVSPEEKWKGVFAECWALLGCDSKGQGDSEHAWEAIAVYLANGWRDQECRSRENISRSGSLNFDKLEVIPQRWEGELTNERHQVIENYLSKACDAVLHPLGRLLDMLVTVYRATYVGVGANKRLLRQAVEEVKSYVRSVFKIVRFLFPELPEGRFVPQTVSSNELPSDVKVKQQCPTTGPLVTHYGLVLPILLPRLYPPLFTIYALQHECRDELYWERVLRLNKQSDVGLLSFLGVQQMFWPIDESLLLEGRQRLSTIRDECFASAVDSLQQISTTFTPSEKLTVIQKTFEEINQSLEGVVQTGYVWSMDDLFPVFLYVVLRARIRNLGSEIHLIEDLMDPFVQHGEQGIMFTTLKACYFQIHKERLT